MFTTCMASLAFPCIARFLSENYPSSVFTLHREVTFLYLLDFMSAICSLHLISCFLIFNSLSFFHTYFDTLFILFSSSVFLLTLHSIQYNQVNLVIYIYMYDRLPSRCIRWIYQLRKHILSYVYFYFGAITQVFSIRTWTISQKKCYRLF